MNSWQPITVRSTSSRKSQLPRHSPTTLDAAFAEFDDLALRLDVVDTSVSSTANEMLVSIRTQLAALDAQRQQLTKLMASLPRLPE